jgi:hypothetical protein
MWRSMGRTESHGKHSNLNMPQTGTRHHVVIDAIFALNHVTGDVRSASMVTCSALVNFLPVSFVVTCIAQTERSITIVDGSNDAFWYGGVSFLLCDHI